MADAKKALRDWFVRHIRGKDAIARAIVDVQLDKDGYDVVVSESARTRRVIISQSLVLADLLPRLSDGVVLVLPNTLANLDALVKGWNELSRIQGLAVYFANPYSLTDKCWVVFPFTHDRVTERKVLRRGLEALFSTVEPYKDVS